MFKRKKTRDSSASSEPVPDVKLTVSESIALGTAVSLLENGHHTTLEDVVMQGLVEDLAQYDSEYDCPEVTDEETAAYDDGSNLAEASVRLAEARALSDDEIARRIQEEYDESVAETERRIVHEQQSLERLRNVLAQAERWNPPPDLENLASFKQKLITILRERIERAESAIEYVEAEPHPRPSIAEYRDKLIRDRQGYIEFLGAHGSFVARNKARIAKREAWAERIRQSLSDVSND